MKLGILLMTILTTARSFLLVATLAFTAACATNDDLNEPPIPMGDFLLGHNIVVADQAVLGPLSRKADPEDWKLSLTNAIDKRLGQTRYDGTRYFHIGTHIDAYVLAVPGVPLVASPKSILIISINVWEDATGKKLTEEPVQLTVYEGRPDKSIIGSGLTQSAAQQMENLSRSGAKAILKFLLENKAWFGDDPVPEEAPVTESSN